MPVVKRTRKTTATGHAETSSDALSAYFAYVKVHSRLLKRAEERRLAELIQKGLSRCPEPEARKNPIAFLKRHDQTEALAAFERLCLANQRLVVSVARKFKPPAPFTLLDLIQEGNCGLLNAVARFDPRRGYRFSTFATWLIRHHVTRWLENSNQTVRLPVKFQKFDAKLRRTERELQSKLGREPTVRETAEALEVNELSVRDAMRFRKQPIVSLNAKLDGEDGAEYQDFLRARNGDPLEALLAVEREQARTIVRRSIEQLDDPFEIDVIRRYYGFADEDRPMTLEDIGRRHGLSRERTRVRKNRTLAKLRALLAKQGLEAP